MKNINFEIALFVALLLNGCDDNASFINETIKIDDTKIVKDTQEKISIDIECSSATVDEYLSLQKGDILRKEEKNTTIKTYQNSSGVKKVCIISGKAVIIREIKE